jgi:hypothetical protein
MRRLAQGRISPLAGCRAEATVCISAALPKQNQGVRVGAAACTWTVAGRRTHDREVAIPLVQPRATRLESDRPGGVSARVFRETGDELRTGGADAAAYKRAAGLSGENFAGRVRSPGPTSAYKNRACSGASRYDRAHASNSQSHSYLHSAGCVRGDPRIKPRRSRNIHSEGHSPVGGDHAQRWFGCRAGIHFQRSCERQGPDPVADTTSASRNAGSSYRTWWPRTTSVSGSATVAPTWDPWCHLYRPEHSEAT